MDEISNVMRENVKGSDEICNVISEIINFTNDIDRGSNDFCSLVVENCSF